MAAEPLQAVEGIGETLAEADAAVEAHEVASQAVEEARGVLEAKRAELNEASTGARAALEKALEETLEPLKQARLALKKLRAETKDEALADLKREVESRRAALQALELRLEPIEETVRAAESNLADSQEVLGELEQELTATRARVEELEKNKGESEVALEDARKQAARLAKAAKKAHDTTRMAAAQVEESLKALETYQKKISRMESARDEAAEAVAVAEAELEAAEAAIGEAEQGLESAKEDLEAARKAQLESSQALSRVETAEEEEAAEAAASDALNRVGDARNARNAAREAIETRKAEAEAKRAAVEVAKAALQEAEEAVAEAVGQLEEQQEKLSEHEEKSKSSDSHDVATSARAAAEMVDLSEAALAAIVSELSKAKGKLKELEVEQEELSTGQRSSEAFLASQREELARASADADVARRAFQESDQRLKDATSSLTASQLSVQQLITALAKVEQRREAYELLLEELSEAQEPALQEEEPTEFADTGAWGSLDALFDKKPEAIPSFEDEDEDDRPAVVARSDLSDTDVSLTPIAHDEAPKPDGPSFRLAVSLPGQHIADYEFSQEEVTVGRDESCDVHLESPVVSRVQFTIRQHDGLFALVDAGTANGTFVNGKKVEGGLTLLNDGDGIGVGKFRLRFVAETQAAFDLASRLEKAGGVELGGMTLRITPEESRRQDGEHDRVRGHLILPNPNGKEPIKHPLSEVFSVGKDISCDLVLRGWFAPKRAAIIARGYDRYTLINVSPGSKDVTVNDEVVRDHRRLQSGDRIEIYGQRFLFREPQG